MILNTPLSYQEDIYYYNTDDNTAIPCSEIQVKVLNVQHKWVINLIFPLVH